MNISTLFPKTTATSLTPASVEFPLVSIIIPNYNHGQYISDAIDSILAQAYRKFEIIVVDDGSTDDSREIVAQYGDAVNYIWQKNQGLSAARNTGIRMAQGYYIALLDADDMYEPDFLSTLVFALLANPDAAGIYCGYQFVDHVNNPLPGGEARSIPAEQLYPVLLDGNFLVPESILIHRRCYESVGLFDESLRACEDWDMWLRITRNFKVIGTSRILTRHRILPGSMSTDPIRMLNNRITVLNKHFDSNPKNGEYGSPTAQRAYGYAYLTSTIEYLQFGDQDKAYGSFKKIAEVNTDLLTHRGVLYELGVGDQPKGQRGHLTSLNLTKNAQIVEDLMHNLFNENDFAHLRNQKNRIYAELYFTLGLIAYNKGDMILSRKFLNKALKFRPASQLGKNVMKLYAKSFVSHSQKRKLQDILHGKNRS